MRKRSRFSLIWLVASLVAILAGVPTGTTGANAEESIYDAPAIARVDDPASGGAERGSALLSDAPHESVSSPMDARRTPTTASVAFVATEAAGGADNVVNGVRLRAQLTGEEIAGGHAFDKHVVQRGEFPGVTTRAGFASTIEDVVMNGEMRVLSNGRTAFWNDSVVVIRNPGALDGGTAFRPTDGYDYFLGLP